MRVLAALAFFPVILSSLPARAQDVSATGEAHVTAPTSATATSTAASASAAGEPGPQAGRMGITLGVPSGGGATVGGAYMVSDTGSVRLDVGLDIPLNPQARFGMSLEGGYRLYITKVAKLSPFVQPGLFVAKPAADTGFDHLQLAGTVGIGAEYFFANEFSIAGATGLAVITNDNFDQIRIATGTTGVYANFYW